MSAYADGGAEFFFAAEGYIMKRKERDEKIEKLFSALVGEEPLPPASVTLPAKQAMEDVARERVTADVKVAADSAGGSSLHGERRLPAYVWYIAAALIVVAVALTLVFTLGKRDGALQVDTLGIVQFERTDAAFGSREKALLPFVDGGNVAECAHYVFRYGGEGYSAGDVGVWYVRFSFDDIPAEVYVEADGVELEELEPYSSLPSYVSGGVVFGLQTYASEGFSRIYFEYANFSYNLRVNTEEEERVRSMADSIAFSL